MVLILNKSAQAVETANYFRMWQGFKRQDLTSESFMAVLPSFMKDTVDIYAGKALNNYIVAIPPQNKPSFVPDELALVGLSSEADYQTIRQTPEGKKYSERHWDVFNKNNSQSAKSFINYQSTKIDTLENNTAYDMIGHPINWSTSYNVVYIGVKKGTLSSLDFLARLQSHIEDARSILASMGLKGYIVISNENYEVAYMNWDSKEAHDIAWATKKAEVLGAEANQFMDMLMYQEAIPFVAGSPVQYGAAYSTLQLRP